MTSEVKHVIATVHQLTEHSSLSGISRSDQTNDLHAVIAILKLIDMLEQVSDCDSFLLGALEWCIGCRVGDHQNAEETLFRWKRLWLGSIGRAQLAR